MNKRASKVQAGPNWAHHSNEGAMPEGAPCERRDHRAAAGGCAVVSRRGLPRCYQRSATACTAFCHRRPLLWTAPATRRCATFLPERATQQQYLSKAFGSVEGFAAERVSLAAAARGCLPRDRSAQPFPCRAVATMRTMPLPHVIRGRYTRRPPLPPPAPLPPLPPPTLHQALGICHVGAPIRGGSSQERAGRHRPRAVQGGEGQGGLARGGARVGGTVSCACSSLTCVVQLSLHGG